MHCHTQMKHQANVGLMLGALPSSGKRVNILQAEQLENAKLSHRNGYLNEALGEEA